MDPRRYVFRFEGAVKKVEPARIKTELPLISLWTRNFSHDKDYVICNNLILYVYDLNFNISRR